MRDTGIGNCIDRATRSFVAKPFQSRHQPGMVTESDEMKPDETLELWERIPPRSWTRSLALTALFVLVCAVIFVVARGTQNLHLDLFVSVALLTLLTVLTAFDLRFYILPDALTFPLIGFGLFWNYWQSGEVFLYVLGAALGYFVFWALGQIWKVRTGSTGLGRGDAKLLAGGGALLGAMQLPVLILISSGLALIAVLGAAVISRTSSPQRLVAFGPYICLAIWCVWSVN